MEFTSPAGRRIPLIHRWLIVLLILLPGLGGCNTKPSPRQESTAFYHPETSIPPASPTSHSPALTPTGLISTPEVLKSTSATSASLPSITSTISRLQTKTPLASPTITSSLPTCLITGGQIEKASLETDLLRLPLEYRIYLPPCYSEQTERRYPVLYLMHGQSFKDDQWDRIGADETADDLIASGEIPPLIIVMPYDRSGVQPIETKFPQVVVEQLVPWIDKNYRTQPERAYRAVGGLSRGGGWAIHFGLVYWKIFGALGGHSPAVFHSDARQMRTFLDTIPPESYPKIYLDIGARDRPEILRAALWFEQLLNEKSIPHQWHLFSGYHNEAYWSEHMAQYLRWYTQDW